MFLDTNFSKPKSDIMIRGERNVGPTKLVDDRGSAGQLLGQSRSSESRGRLIEH